jgi:hypothetical protein
MRWHTVLLTSLLPVAALLVDCSGYGDSEPGPANDAGGEATAIVPARDAGVDATRVRRCDAAKPFGMPKLVPELNAANTSSANIALSEDERTAYLVRSPLSDAAVLNYDIYSATRPSSSAAFSDLSRVAELSTGEQEVYLWSWRDTLFFGRQTNGVTNVHFATKGATGFGNEGQLQFPDGGPL